MNKIFAMLVALGLSVSLFGQERTITGKVTDAVGLDLPGVTVQLVGTTTGTVTATDGTYSLTVTGGVLRFSYIGFAAQEVAIGDREVIDMGEYRVVTDKCMQCHQVTMDTEPPKDVKLEDLSINLMLSKSRLRHHWVKNFLRNPDRYAGQGTKMPFVYYTPDRVPRIPDPEMWIEYTTLYLMFMDQPPKMVEEKTVEAVRPGSEVDWTSY